MSLITIPHSKKCGYVTSNGSNLTTNLSSVAEWLQVDVKEIKKPDHLDALVNTSVREDDGYGREEHPAAVFFGDGFLGGGRWHFTWSRPVEAPLISPQEAP